MLLSCNRVRPQLGSLILEDQISQTTHRKLSGSISSTTIGECIILPDFHSKYLQRIEAEYRIKKISPYYLPTIPIGLLKIIVPITIRARHTSETVEKWPLLQMFVFRIIYMFTETKTCIPMLYRSPTLRCIVEGIPTQIM